MLKPLLLFALIPAAMGAHVLLATKFAIYDRYAALPIGVGLVALGGLAALLRAAPGAPLWGLNIAGWLLLAGFVWWTHSYSTYRGLAGAPQAGTDMLERWGGDLRLRDSAGEPFDLPAALGADRATLLVFYRGYW